MTDWFKEIKKHHKEIKAAFETAIKSLTLPNIENVQLKLDAHAISEEAVIYPQLSLHKIDDDELLEHEQTEAKEIIHNLVESFPKLKKYAKAKREFVIHTTLTDLLAAVLEHAIVHEEKDKFKKLHALLSVQENNKLGIEYMEHYNLWLGS